MRILAFVCALICAGSTIAAAGDLAAGEKVYSKCKACHAIGLGAKNKVGPILNGVVGQPWGEIEGYKYSAGKEGTLLAIAKAEPVLWDVKSLTAYLQKPKDVIPKGKMPFAGLKKDEDIENVIFYLAQFDRDGNEVDPEAVLFALPE